MRQGNAAPGGTPHPQRRNLLTRRAILSGFRVWHSQTVRDDQPSDLSWARLRRSRVLVASRFAAQKYAFVLGFG